MGFTASGLTVICTRTHAHTKTAPQHSPISVSLHPAAGVGCNHRFETLIRTKLSAASDGVCCSQEPNPRTAQAPGSRRFLRLLGLGPLAPLRQVRQGEGDQHDDANSLSFGSTGREGGREGGRGN